MASSVVRRPLPALIALVALLLLTAIVWWRVLHRDSGTPGAKACPTPTPTSSQTGSALPPPSTVTVQVVNSTKRNGIAAARTTLIRDGFLVPTQAANDPSKTKAANLGVAQLRYGPTGLQAATHLRFYFPGAAMVPTTSANAVVVVALGKAYKAIATPAVVSAAMKAAAVTVASPSPSPAPSPAATC